MSKPSCFKENRTEFAGLLSVLFQEGLLEYGTRDIGSFARAYSMVELSFKELL